MRHAASAFSRWPEVIPQGSGRRRLASGALTVAMGLAVTGASTIVVMALTARSLPTIEYAAFAVWWTMATLLGTSFGVFEAYLARLALAEVVAGNDPRHVIGSLAGRAAVVSLVIAGALLAAGPWLREHLFHGSTAATLALPLFVALAASQAIQRGAATGFSQFRAIAAQLAADGGVRALLVGFLVVAGRDSIATLTWAACTSAALSLVVGGRFCATWITRPRVRGDGISSKPLALLLVGSVGPLLVSNGSVPWLASTQDVSALTLGAFAGAVTLSRLPTQFVAAAFGPLLAQLSHSVGVGDKPGYDHLRKSADVAALVLGLLFVVLFAALGPAILALYLGPSFQLSVVDLTFLAAASGLMFVTVVPQAGLAALNRWSTIAVAWVTGCAAFCVVLTLPLEAVHRASLAPLATVVTALILLVVLRAVRERQWDGSSGTVSLDEPA